MTARFFRLVVFASLAASGREAAAQFSLPYDPDFPSEPAKAEQPAAPRPVEAPAVPAAPAAGAEAGEPAVAVPAAAGPFLLRDRPDKDRIFEKPAEPPAGTAAEPVDFSEFRKGLKPIEFSRERWNQARDNIEAGKAPVEAPVVIPGLIEPRVAVSTAPPHKPPPPEVELPTYGTSLSVTGRKVISFQYSEKRYINEQKSSNRPMTSGMLDITQQLQLRMQGKVGPKISVNVDYDDTKANKQDISVVYQGDPNEVVQNVSFGDIYLSLPPTEFVQYNKQLFGIRADVKYKGLKASLIGSRTKGQTKFRQYYGNTQFASADIIDTSYLRRQHYDVSFSSPGRLPIQGGSERVYLARQNLGDQINLNDVVLTVDDLAVGSSSFTGRFSQLTAGIDYTIDYAKGILTFRYQLQDKDVAAVDYVDANNRSITVQSTTTVAGGTGRLKLVKTASDLPIAVSTEVGHNREFKTFYSIGQNQIVRDDGRGNFVLKVLDPTTRNEVGSALNPPQKYPETIDVDFENGIFRLLSPFSVSNSCPTVPDGDIQTPGGIYSATPISKRLFRVEYHFRFKTFFLEPSLVPQSEVVLLDRVKLTRNVDYFIDYDAGFITFFNEDRLRPDSEISISYEVAPFLGLSNESLLGTRVSYDWKKLSMGSTLLYQAGIKSPSVPTVTELARSLLTYEFDSKLTDIQLLRWLRMTSVAGEFAQSRHDPNLNDYALIDNMEGIKVETMAPTLDSSWKIGANPAGIPSDPLKIQWLTRDEKVLRISPRSEAGSEETQKVLVLKYDFSDGGTQEVSIVYPFSVSGEDFSQKNILEVVMLGDSSGNEINFHLGGIGEDADNDGALDTEDSNRDGLIQELEDVGMAYDPAGKPSASFGVKNGRIDSEDLNLNGRLDGQDLSGDDYGYLGTDANSNNQKLHDATDSSDHTVIDFGNDKWRTFQIPLNISTATAKDWTAIKHIRISIRKKAGGSACAAFLNCGMEFARIAVVGNSWLRGAAGDPATGQGQTAAGETLTATPVNSVDNPDYVPIFNAAGQAAEAFKDLYGDVSTLQKQTGSRNISEQALQLEFDKMGAGSVVFTKRIFGRAVDISQHKHFNFLVYGNADAVNSDVTGNKVFFLRVGNDVNFFEARVPITFTGWRKIEIHQADANGDMIAEEWRATAPDVVIISSGSPSLQQVAQVVAGARCVGATAVPKGRLYLNEIYLSEPVTRVGLAKKLEANFDIPGWASFGVKHWSRDRNFQTPTSVVTNQNRREDSTYLNFSRLRFLPMNFSVSRAVTETPSTVKTGDLSNTVNLLQQGKVTNWNGSASGNFSLGSWPRLSLGHTHARTEYDLLTRADDRQTYNASLTYGVPLDWRVLPKTVDASYSMSRYQVSFESPAARRLPGNANTRELGQTYIGRMTFTPWQGSGLNPNYSLTRVIERRADLTSTGEIAKAYPKSLNQSAGFNSNWRLLRWLNPQLNYAVDIIENNILSVSTFVVFGPPFVFDVGDIKTVNRNANGSVNLPISIGEIFPKTKFFRSFHTASSYQVQDGDVWNNVEKGLRSQFGLWVRESLKPQNPAAQRSNQTLRDTVNSSQRWNPLEAYGIRGRLSAFKTIALSNNYVKSVERTDVTGTVSKRISTTLPDMVASVGQLEKLWFTDRWMANTQMNFKYSLRKTETVATTLEDAESFGTDLRTIVLKKFDSLVNYNFSISEKKDLRINEMVQRTSHEDATVQVTFDVRKFRFTPKFDYTNDVTRLGTGLKTQDLTTLAPSLLVRADLALPKGLKLPGASKPLMFTNRIIWTTTMSMLQKTSPITIADNSRLLAVNTSGDYEIAKNLRMTMNGALMRLWHKYLKEEEYVSYQLGSTLTFQF
ncbi:MAG: hypothetical protein HY748_02230 [Elusimicrobia bacterium]|nr:hypothetical protein [Elusimicrobiota bacterium]